jgi:hypothetical protein
MIRIGRINDKAKIFAVSSVLKENRTKKKRTNAKNFGHVK